MNERLAHLALSLIALLGLLIGLALASLGLAVAARQAWALATIPIILFLAVAIIRDFLIGRVGVDAIALVSMTAAIALGEPLAGVVVAVMYAGGNLLEDYARGRAERDLRALRDRTPRTAHRRKDGVLADVPADEIGVDDQLLVRAGEVLPVDGEPIDGDVVLDESAVTGEPLTVTRHPGDFLRSGTVNAGEAFFYRATAPASRSTYAGIVRMVEAAQTARAPFIRLADRFALILLPVTLAVAGIAWLASNDPLRALAVLVVATPCPLILAAPVAFIGGVSRAARLGILMKGSSALEALASARTALFDKTGTLTEGGARIAAMATAPGTAPNDLLTLIASLEQTSHSLIAATLVEAARERHLILRQPTDVREYRGSGLAGTVDGRRLRVGSRKLVLGEADPPAFAQQAAAGYRRGALLVYVAVDDEPVGLVILTDTIRPEAATALQRLRQLGISRVVMLTGDAHDGAREVAATLAIEEVHADRSPGDKLAHVEEERRRQPTMMVGDGINDAPALAAANVGIAMGARGATASSEAADIVVLTDRLDRVADAFAIARRTRAIALQSIVIGLALSGLGMVAAAFGFLTPVAGAILQEAIDVAVILNALRTLGGSLPTGRRTGAAGPGRAAPALGPGGTAHGS